MRLRPIHMNVLTSLRLVAACVLLCLFSIDVRADHIIGSDITYSCSDKNDSIFNVKFSFYRDCNGCYVLGQSPRCGTSENCNSSLTAPTSLSVKCKSGGTTIPNLALKRTSITDITTTCKSTKSRCQQPCNGSFPYGIEKHVFEGELDLRNAIKNGCCEFEISALLYVRNVGITTGQSTQSFYTSCELNACLDECNSSPTLTNDPVAILCCNQTYTFNNGAVDTTNYDSISYELAPAYRGAGQQCTYSGGRSPKNPMSVYYPGGLKFPFNNPNASPPIGIYLDPQTGDLIFTPTKCNEVAVVVIQMTEWRKDSTGTYKKIGVTRRDMQFLVMNCPGNNAPIITNKKFGYSVCEEEEICFDIVTDDKVFIPPSGIRPDPDTTYLTWNRGIPGASFTINDPTARLKTAKFCWTPPKGSASSLPYTFTATVKDNACPLNATATRAFSIRVKPTAETVVDIDTLDCGRYSVSSSIVANFRNPPNYTWQLRDSSGNLLFDRKQGYFESTGGFLGRGEHDTILFRKGGKYIIQHDINNGANCPKTYYDTLVVPPLLEVDLAFGPDTFVCAGEILRLQPSIQNATNPIKYTWGGGDTTAYFDVSLPSWQKDSAFYVEIVDGSGCLAWDSVEVFLRENPWVDVGPDRRICTYDSFSIFPNDSLAYWDDPRDTTEYRIRQGDTLYYEWFRDGVSFSTDTAITDHIAGEYVLKVVDSLGCYDQDTMVLIVNDTVTANAGPDDVLCFDELIELVANGLDTAGNNGKSGNYRWWDLMGTPSKTNLGTDDTLRFNAVNSADYQLELWITEDTTTCYDDDTVSITVNPLPIVNMPSDKEICQNDGRQNLRLLEDQNASGGDWFCNSYPGIVNSGYLFEADSSPRNISVAYQLGYRYVDPSTGCVKVDSFEMKVNRLPDVLLRDGYFCQDKEIVHLEDDRIIMLPGNLNAGRQEVNCIDCRGYDWDDILEDLGPGTPGAPQEFVLHIDETTIPLNTNSDTIVIEFIFRNQFGCLNRDTAKIAITKVPEINFRGFDELCWDEGEVELKRMSGVTPNDGIWTVYDTISPSFRRAADMQPALSGQDTFAEDTLNTMLTPSAGGTYYMRYWHFRSGCPTYRDTTLTIHPLPDPQIIETNLQDVTNFEPYLFCETNADKSLTATPGGGMWSSPESGAVAGSSFRPSSSPTGYPFYIYYDFTDLNGCEGRDSVQVEVEALPTVDILNNDTALCRTDNMSIDVRADYSNTSGVTWLALSSGGSYTGGGNQVTFNFNVPNDTVETQLLFIQTEPGNACPFVEDIYSVTIHPVPDVTVTPDDPDGCNPHTVNFTTVINNGIDEGTSSYDWIYSDGGTSTDQNPTYVFTQDGLNTADVTITSAFGCDTTISTDIEVYPIPVARFEPDPNNSTTAALPRFQFTDQSTVADVLGATIDTWSWDFGNPAALDDTSAEQNPLFFYPADTGQYVVTLRIRTNQGCEDEFSMPVIIGPDILVFIPNAFSPDGGGPATNDGWKPVVNDGVQTYYLQVFNRWGERLFETTDRDAVWDGTYQNTPVQSDVYAYLLKVKSWDGDELTYMGTITLLR
jgi:gliding motility-associated-like protein